MTEQEWLSSNDPKAMLDFLTRGNVSPSVAGGQGWRVSARKLRLWACAVAWWKENHAIYPDWLKVIKTAD